MVESLSNEDDAFGRLLLDHLSGEAGQLVLELDDGRAGPALPAEAFFAEHRRSRGLPAPRASRRPSASARKGGCDARRLRHGADDVRQPRPRRDGRRRRADPALAARHDDAEREDRSRLGRPVRAPTREISRTRSGTARVGAPGQVTIRPCYGALATPWYELLNVSARELEELASATGVDRRRPRRWRPRRVLRGPREGRESS